jgi:hypothetical protein
VIDSLGRHARLGQHSQFLIHQRQELLRGGGIALFDLLQDLGDIVHWRTA